MNFIAECHWFNRHSNIQYMSDEDIPIFFSFLHVHLDFLFIFYFFVVYEGGGVSQNVAEETSINE